MIGPTLGNASSYRSSRAPCNDGPEIAYTMLDAVKQSIIIAAAGLLAFIPSRWVLRALETGDGALGGPLALADQPIIAVVAIITCSVWFGVLALACGRLSHRYTGSLVFGLGWTMIALRSITSAEMFRLIDGPLVTRSYPIMAVLLALECLLWAVPAGLTVFALAKLAPTRYQGEQAVRAGASLAGSAACLAIALLLSWVVLRTDAKGQAVFGLIFAFAVSVMLVRMVVPHCNGSVLFLVPVVVGVIGYLVGAVLMGDAPLDALADGRTWPLSRPLPMEYLGSGLMGVSLGIAMARSFGSEQEE